MKVQKKIFNGFIRTSILVYAALSLLMVHLMALSAYAAKVVHYKTYHPRTGEEVNRFYGSTEKNLSGGYHVHWVIEEGGVTTQEDYTLDEYFGTLRFRVVNADEKTDYAGERKEDRLFIRGQFKGEKIERAMEIDERPFYYNPKIGLAAFVLSGEKQGTFWGFQNKELKAYPMKAIHGGPDTISVNGKDVEAVKVYWTVNDFRSVFFKRTYWFRGADGLYLKQRTDGGKFRELVSEEGEP